MMGKAVMPTGRGPAHQRLRRRPSEAQSALLDLSARDTDPGGIARRHFLQGALALGGATAAVPTFLSDLAHAGPPLGPTDRILVSVFLAGGNDALNTVVPADDGNYHTRRGSMAVNVNGSTALGDGLYLNPRLGRLKTRFDAGQVAVVRGIGEPTDDHSHFTSMSTWMSAQPSNPQPSGWLGRYVDGLGLDGLAAVNVGWGGVPLTLRGQTSASTALPPQGNLFGAEQSELWEKHLFDSLTGLAFRDVDFGKYGQVVAYAYYSAINTAETLEPVYDAGLPEDGLARDLAIAARVINLNVGVRVMNVTLDGFDTHDAQDPLHGDLLTELDTGIDAFFSTLSPVFASRTCLFVWSEFGRRAESNDSGGTDHGTAGVAFLVGPRVNGGLHSTQPSLASLDPRGDLRHTVDFRSVYATILSTWLQADDTEILGADHATLDLFAEAGPGGFFDVESGRYFSTAVAWLAETGITTGTEPGQFSPDDPVTRGQMATFLWRYNGSPGGSPTAPFGDVDRSRYFAPAVDWLYAQGITTGTSPSEFSPDDPVTRGQMATFLWRHEGEEKGSPPSNFRDVSPSRYYAPAVDWLLHRGITTGTSATEYSPEDEVTRAQMATFLWRLAGSPV
jgi:uncharacterized protein (DUF1501 family)